MLILLEVIEMTHEETKQKDVISRDHKKATKMSYIKFFLELAIMILFGFLALYPLILFLKHYIA